MTTPHAWSSPPLLSSWNSAWTRRTAAGLEWQNQLRNPFLTADYTVVTKGQGSGDMQLVRKRDTTVDVPPTFRICRMGMSYSLHANALVSADTSGDGPRSCIGIGEGLSQPRGIVSAFSLLAKLVGRKNCSIRATRISLSFPFRQMSLVTPSAGQGIRSEKLTSPCVCRMSDDRDLDAAFLVIEDLQIRYCQNSPELPRQQQWPPVIFASLRCPRSRAWYISYRQTYTGQLRGKLGVTTEHLLLVEGLYCHQMPMAIARPAGRPGPNRGGIPTQFALQKAKVDHGLARFSRSHQVSIP